MKLYFVVPCYNEEEMLPISAPKLKSKMLNLIKNKKISKDSKIVFVNDGSKDNTWEIINNLCDNDKIFIGIKLSRNVGHQNALLAGLMYAKDYADAAISLDADLQDDIDAIDQMIDAYNNGDDIVYGVRSSRKTDKWFKRVTAEGFYKIMKKMGVETIYNHADYRLMSKRSLEALSEYQEVNVFLRGMVPLIGFSSSVVTYERKEREAGQSNYPLKKMLHLAFDGITSFSVKPIKIIMFFGLLVSFLSFLVLIYTLVVKFTGHTVDGWAFIVVSIWLLGGIQMFAIGVVGEYIGKIYKETKHRPKYFIDKIID